MKPIQHPSGVHGYRVLGIQKDGTRVMIDYRHSEEFMARQEVCSEKYRSVMLSNRLGHVIYGRMAESDLKTFPEMFQSSSGTQLAKS